MDRSVETVIEKNKGNIHPGDVYVLKAGPTFEVLAKNAMGETCLASPAISGGVIFIRTASRIVAIGAGK